MWRNGYLTQNLGRAIVKEMLKSKTVMLAEAQNQFEKEQIDRVKKDINRSRVGKNALTYALLFENIYVDESSIGGLELSASDDKENLDFRPILEFSDHSTTQHCFFTSSIKRFYTPSDNKLENTNLLADGFQLTPHETVKMFKAFEPFVWQRMQVLGKKAINRDLLGEIIETLVKYPNILPSIIYNEDDTDFDFLKATLAPFGQNFHLNKEWLNYFQTIIKLLHTKGTVALSYVRESQRLNAAMPLMQLPAKPSGKRDFQYIKSLNKHEEIIASVDVFLDEIEFLPKIRCFSEIAELRQKSAFVDFRHVMAQWVEAFQTGDTKKEKRIRHKIKLSNRALKRAANYNRIGKFCTAIGPISFCADFIVNAPLSLVPTFLGIGALQLAEDEKIRNKWILIGRN